MYLRKAPVSGLFTHLPPTNYRQSNRRSEFLHSVGLTITLRRSLLQRRELKLKGVLLRGFTQGPEAFGLQSSRPRDNTNRHRKNFRREDDTVASYRKLLEGAWEHEAGSTEPSLGVGNTSRAIMNTSLVVERVVNLRAQGAGRAFVGLVKRWEPEALNLSQHHPQPGDRLEILVSRLHFMLPFY